MSESLRAMISKKRTIHTYSELGAAWQFLSSLVLTAFTFEAYLNHVGAGLFADWEAKDRLPVMCKFDLLCTTLNVAFTEGKGQRPLQTVHKLMRFRNTVAHGRTVDIVAPDKAHRVDDNLNDRIAERVFTDWEEAVQTVDFATRAREDVEATLTRLHEARPDPKEGLFAFGMGLYTAKVSAV